MKNTQPGRLQSHIVTALVSVALCASAMMLLVIGLTWKSVLQTQREEIALQTSRLLQATLENAMLKRDVPGLETVVARLGQQPGVVGVYIVNRQGEVRFSSRPEALGEILPGGQATWATPDNIQISTQILKDRSGQNVIRAINPVKNQTACLACHGGVDTHPVNGTLLIDLDASPIASQMWQSMFGLMLAGLLVMATLAGALAWLLRRRVIQPLEVIERAVLAFDQGESQARAPLVGQAEIRRVADAFNRTAERLIASRHDIEAERQRLQHIVDSLPDAVCVLDTEGHVRAVNRAYCELYELPPGTLPSSRCYAITHRRSEPCVPTMVLCPLHELSEARPNMRCNQRHVRANGTVFPVEVHAARFSMPGEPLPWIVESIRDLSTQAQVSQEERLAEVGLLAAGVAHEIHNPLASVRLAVQMLSQEVQSGQSTDKAIQDYLQLVDREIDKCLSVTQRLLLLARKPTGELQAVDLARAIDDTFALLAFDALQHQVTHQAILPPSSAWVLGEDAELRMVLINLIQNAHHAMPNGGTLTISLSREAEHYILSVKDTGVGIPPENLPRIFDPFFTRRADGQTGTGLGLTICRSIIESCGGSIRVSSMPGQGSTFTLTLPAYTDTVGDLA